MSEEVEDVLKGLTLKVYRYVLKQGRPVGTREVQRGLGLSSPSLAVYHFTKLEDAGLLRRDRGDYVVDKVFLRSVVRLSHMLIPRYFFYSIFFISAFILELLVFRPETLTSGYFFSVVVIFASALTFCYETAKTWLKGSI
ncbi:MAG: ArsR family transcriptional regulator [Nitrososphaeria archaeon]|nr:ArsR family transcriptional regulator [Nitrososphaeria archaeon]NIQ34120.1 ArsR family transcriptional regulator [Nitrososphaeria archaeon]